MFVYKKNPTSVVNLIWYSLYMSDNMNSVHFDGIVGMKCCCKWNVVK